VVFVADDLGSWLIGLLADAGRKRLTDLVFGADQERALRAAATAAIRSTAAELRPDSRDDARQLVEVISQVFRAPGADAPLGDETPLLRALQAGITRPLAVLDDSNVTGIGRSSADLLGVSAGVVADRLFGQLLREIVLRGSRGGPLAPLAAQLNHDVTHLQGQRIEEILGRLDQDLRDGLARPDGAPATTAARSELPPGAAHFTGRRGELTRLRRVLSPRDAKPGRAVSICAISGKPGVGKSALAVHAAYELAAVFPDGQLYVNLRGDDRPLPAEIALEDLLRRFGISGNALPRTLDGKAAAYRTQLAGQRTLVVLDNAADEQQVRPLLPGTPGCAAIVTSRQTLAALDATLIDLDVLAPDVSLTLLRRVAGSTRLRADPEAATAVAKLCGYLPLALRIAAAKLACQPRWTTAYLADRLSDERRRLAVLGVGDLDVRACFALSYVDLPAEDARAFRLLGLVPGPDFGPGTAEDILGRDGETTEALLERLARLQLLEMSWLAGRYRFHDLLRLYARERLEADEPAAARAESLERMLEGYADMSQIIAGMSINSPFHTRAYAVYVDSADGDGKDRQFVMFETERENLLAAINTAQDSDDGWSGYAWRIAENLTDFLLLRGYWSDAESVARSWLKTVGDEVGVGKREIYSAIRANLTLGQVCSRRERWREAISHLKMVLEFTELGDASDLLSGAGGDALYELGQAHAALRQWDEARAYYIRCAEFLQQRGEDFGTKAAAHIILGLGVVNRAKGNWDKAAAQMQDSLKMFTEAGDVEGIALAYLETGMLGGAAGRWDLVLPWYEQSLRAWQAFERGDHGNSSGRARTLNAIGVAYRQQGQWDEAITRHEQALELFRYLGIRAAEAQALTDLASAYVGQGRPDEAAATSETAAVILAELGLNDEEFWAQVAEAGSPTAAYRMGVLLTSRDRAAAERWYRRAVDAGSTDAAVNLGVLIAERNPAEAERLYRIAASAGDHDGQHNLAALLYRSDRLQEAEDWCRQAAERGHHAAESLLGAMLARQGQVAEAKIWWGRAESGLRKAAKGGDRNAVHDLAIMLVGQGRGGEAESWFRRAAETGNLNALTNLGVLLHDQGRLDDAIACFRDAAKAGDARAAAYLKILQKDQEQPGSDSGSS
jgi:tetratricopeptide (TPR) repeat protein